MADNYDILGISAHLDLGDVAKSVNELLLNLEKIGVATDTLSERMISALSDIVNSSDSMAIKQRRAMTVLSQGITEAKDVVSSAMAQYREAFKSVDVSHLDEGLGQISVATKDYSQTLNDSVSALEQYKTALQSQLNLATEGSEAYNGIKAQIEQIDAAIRDMTHLSLPDIDARNFAQKIIQDVEKEIQENPIKPTIEIPEKISELKSALKNAYAELAEAEGNAQKSNIEQRLTNAIRKVEEYNRVLEALKREQASGGDSAFLKETEKDLTNAENKVLALRREYAELIETITQKQANVKALEDAKKSGEGFNKEIEKTPKKLDDLGNAMQKVKKYALGFLTVASIQKFISKIVEVTAEIESLRAKFEGLMGAEGINLFKDIEDFSFSKGLYDTKTLANAALILQRFGKSAEEIMPLLHQMGEIAMGDGSKLNSFATALGRLEQQGKVTSLTLRTLQSAGFNPLSEIAKNTGESIDEVNKRLRIGAVSVQEVKDAMVSATSEGGKYYGMMDRIGETIRGHQQSLKIAFEKMYSEIGQKQSGLIVEGYKVAESFVRNYEKVGSVLVSIIGIYGTYKAAIMATNALYAANIGLKSVLGMQAAVDALTVKQQAFNASVMRNPYVFAAVAIATLIGTIYSLNSVMSESNSAIKEVHKETDSTIAKVDLLKETLLNAEKGTKEYNKAMEEFNDIARANQAATLDENKAIQEQVEIFENLEKAILKAAAAKIYNKQIEAAQEEYSEDVEDLRGEIKKDIWSEGSRFDRNALSEGQYRYIEGFLQQRTLELAKLGEGTEEYKKELDALINETFKWFEEKGVIVKDLNAQQYGFAVRNLREKIGKRIEDYKDAAKDFLDATNQAKNELDGFMSESISKDKAAIKTPTFEEDLLALKEAMEGVSDTKIEPDTKGLEKTAEEAQKTKEKLNDVGETKVSPEVSDKDFKLAIEQCQNWLEYLEGIDDYVARPNVDESQLDKAKEEAKAAIEEVKKLDLSKATPQTDNSHLIDTLTKARRAIDNLNNLGKSNAKPKVDPMWINNLIGKLKTALDLYQKIGGIIHKTQNTLNGAGTKSGTNAVSNSVNRVQKGITEPIKKRIEDAIKNSNTDNEDKILIQQLQKVKGNAKQGGDFYNYLEGAIDRIEAKSKKRKDAAAKKAEAEAKRNQKKAEKEGKEKEKREGDRIADEIKFRKELLDLSRQAAREESDAEIEAIQNNAVRERAKRAEEHRRRMEDYDLETEDILKAIYDRRKREYERTHKDKSYETTPEGKITWFDKDEKTGEYKMLQKPLSEQEKEYEGARLKVVQGKQKEETARRAREIENDKKKSIESWRNFLKEYGSLEEKRLAITQEYEDKIKKAREAGDAGQVATLTMKAEEELKKIEAEQLRKSINWDAIFGDISEYDLDFLNTIQDDLEKAIKDGIERGIDAADLKVLTDKLQEVREQLAEKGGLFGLKNLIGGSWIGSVSTEIEKQRNREQRAQDARNEADRTKANWINAVYKKNAAQEEYDKKKEELGEEAPETKDALAKLGIASDKATKAQEEAAAAAGEAAAAESGVAQGAGAMAFAITDAIIHGVNQNLQSANQMIQEWGIGSEDFQEKFAKFAESSEYATQAFDSLKNGDIAGVVFNLGNAFNSLGESFGLWTNSNVEESEKEIERLINSNAELGKALDNLRDELKNINISDTSTYEKAKEVANAQIANAMRATQTKMAEYSGHHSTNYYSGEATQLLREIAENAMEKGIIDTKSLKGVGNINELLKLLSPDELDKLRTFDPQGWIKFMEALRDADKANLGAADSFLEYVNTYSDLMDELEKEWKETVTNLSWDSLKSSFASALEDMKKDVNDWSNDLEDIFRSGVSNYLSTKYTDTTIDTKTGKPTGILAQWYDKYFEAMQSGNLDAHEIADLRKEYLDIVQEATAERDKLYDTLGIVNTRDQQSASANSAMSVTYDQADALTGILLGHTILFEQIFAEVGNQSVYMSSIEENTRAIGINVGSINENVRVIVETQNSMNAHLADISANTRVLPEVRDELVRVRRLVEEQ